MRQHDGSCVASGSSVYHQYRHMRIQVMPRKTLSTSRMSTRVRSSPCMYSPATHQHHSKRTLYRCRANELLSLNDFRHSAHVCGRSPVCTRVCTVSADRWMNSLPHSSHLYGLYHPQHTHETNICTSNPNESVLHEKRRQHRVRSKRLYHGEPSPTGEQTSYGR